MVTSRMAVYDQAAQLISTDPQGQLEFQAIRPKWRTFAIIEDGPKQVSKGARIVGYISR